MKINITNMCFVGILINIHFTRLNLRIYYYLIMVYMIFLIIGFLTLNVLGGEA